MFGHHDDVIKQDQKRNADVQLPDSAFELLTTPTNDSGSTNNATNDQQNSSQQNDDSQTNDQQTPVPTDLPPVNKTSIDGISNSPSNSLASPFDLAEAHRRAQESNQSEPKKQLSAPEPKPQERTDSAPKLEEPEELSYTPEQAATFPNMLHDEPEQTTDQYLSQLQNGSLDDLVGIKQSALEQLAPLVGQLELPPADKFKTFMMLIQASDNQNLIPKAYEAAQAIQDEQLRAQALLDIVNEINYFTQQKKSSND